MTPEELDHVKLKWYSGIVRREDVKVLWEALEAAWKERDDAIKERDQLTILLNGAIALGGELRADKRNLSERIDELEEERYRFNAALLKIRLAVGLHRDSHDDLVVVVGQVKMERDELKATVKVLNERLVNMQEEWDDAKKTVSNLCLQNSELIEDNAAMRLDRDAYKFASEQAMGMGTAKAIMDERDTLKHQVRELQETVKVLSERLAEVTAERDALKDRLHSIHCDVTTETVSQRS